MFVPAIMVVGAPDPAIGVNHDAPLGVPVIMVSDMPALAFGVAGNFGHCACGRERKSPQAEDRSGSQLRNILHASSPGLDRHGPPVEIQPLTQNATINC